MRVLAATFAMRPWTAAVDDGQAIFGYAATQTAKGRGLVPHLRSGRGLLVPDTAVHGLLASVRAAMTTPEFAKAGRRATGGGYNPDQWGTARHDAVAECIYLDGPVSGIVEGDGYQPVRTVFVPLDQLRGLQDRLTIYLEAPGR